MAGGSGPRSTRPRRRSIWVYVVITVALGLTLGTWAFAAIVLNHATQSGQGQSVQYTGAVPGVVVLGTLYPNVPNPAPARASIVPNALTTITMGATAGGHVVRFCANACTIGHFSEELEYTVTAQAAAEGMQLSITAHAGANAVITTIYFHIPATVAGGRAATLDIYIDLVATSPLLSVSAAAQQCSSALACP